MPCHSSLRRKIASDCDSFYDMARERSPHSGLVGDRDVCDRKPRRFAIAILVFSGLVVRRVWCLRCTTDRDRWWLAISDRNLSQILRLQELLRKELSGGGNLLLPKFIPFFQSCGIFAGRCLGLPFLYSVAGRSGRNSRINSSVCLRIGDGDGKQPCPSFPCLFLDFLVFFLLANEEFLIFCVCPSFLGGQHLSPNVKTPLQIWAANRLEIITSRDAKSACFQGSQTSCIEIISGVFGQNLAEKDHITWWMRPADFP